MSLGPKNDTLIPPTSRFPNSRFSLTRGFLSAISLQIRGLRLSNSRFLRIFVFCITRDVEELKMSRLMSGTLPTDPNFFEFSRSRAYVIKYLSNTYNAQMRKSNKQFNRVIFMSFSLNNYDAIKHKQGLRN